MCAMRASELVFRVCGEYNGWLIVGVVFLAAALTIGSSNYAFGLFIEPLEREFAWPRTSISASLSFMAVGSLAAPILGRLLDRYGSKPLMIGSLTLIGLSFVLRPLMTELWHWYLLSFFQFVSFSGASALPAGRLVGIWFQRAHGRVMGIMMMGNNFGGLTIPIMAGIVLATASWQRAYVVLGVIAFAIALLALLVVHERPDYATRTPGNGGTPAPGNRGSSATLLRGWTVREALRTRSFYAMTLAMMMASFAYSTVVPHVSAHLAAKGMEDQKVYLAIGLLATFGMIGKLSFGYLAERITARRAMMVSLGGQIVFIVLMVAYPHAPQVWFSVPLFGLCMGAYGTLVALIVQESYGLRHFGSISGLANMATVVPFLAGPLMAGASFQYTGSYGPSFLIVAVLYGTGIASLTQAGQQFTREPAC
jgi:MFS family permease